MSMDLSAAISGAAAAHAVIQYRNPAAISQLTEHDYNAMRAFVTPLVEAAAPHILRQFAADLRAERDDGASIRHDWAIKRLLAAAEALGGAE